jgi:AcrR family transcriptional regulator
MSELTEKGKQRRDIIIAAGDKLLRQYGYEETTLRMLAQDVGISRGHLGHYFKEKKDLLFVLTDVTLKNLWYGSDRLCSEWNDPYITYAFAVHWFFLLCVRLGDIKRVIFQALKHWEIQREFSQRFAQKFIKLLEKYGNDFDHEKIAVSVQMAFAAEFNYICEYEERFSDSLSTEGSDLHINILFMLLSLNGSSQATNNLVHERINLLTIERLIIPFTYTYQWYEIDNNPFIV